MPMMIPILVTLLFLACSSFALGLFLSWRSFRRQTDANGTAILSSIETMLRTHALQIQIMHDAAEVQRRADATALSAHVDTIQSDVEWLAGEKMIAEAVKLVQDNMPLSQISHETGLSHDTIRTLATYRTH